jgi:hypothetical protein
MYTDGGDARKKGAGCTNNVNRRFHTVQSYL